MSSYSRAPKFSIAKRMHCYVRKVSLAFLAFLLLVGSRDTCQALMVGGRVEGQFNISPYYTGPIWVNLYQGSFVDELIMGLSLHSLLTLETTESFYYSKTIVGPTVLHGQIELKGTGFIHMDTPLPNVFQTRIMGGSMYVEADIGGEVVVYDGTKLGGTGRILGAAIVANGGILTPGDFASVGTISTGGLALLPNATLDFQLGSPGVIGSGINDLIEVTGDLVLDGLLNITNVSSFGPGAYRLINYTGALTNNGLLVNVIPTGVNPGDLYLDVSTAGQVNLYYFATASGQQYWTGTAFAPTGTIAGGSGVWSSSGYNFTNAQWRLGGPNRGVHCYARHGHARQ